MQKPRTKARPHRARSNGDASLAPLAPKEARFRFAWKPALLLAAGLGAAIVAFFFFQSRMGRNSPPVFRCDVVAAYPHDSGAFTQGLVYDDGFLCEGTGGYGASSLRRVELETHAGWSDALAFYHSTGYAPVRERSPR